MASGLTHLFTAAALGKTYTGEKMPCRFWALAACCSLVPDLDVLGYYYGIRYADIFGHRGFTHSLFFALLLSLAAVVAAFRSVPALSKRWWSLVAFFFAVTASHGILDAMTDKGYGIAFFLPFDGTRYFLPWRPIHASPMRISQFFSRRGIEIVAGEILWIWIPLTLVAASAWWYRRKKKVVRV
jgi:inner membrane protein